MKTVRQIALACLVAVFAASLLAEWVAPASYVEQFRQLPDAPPSLRFPLGTDELGRDRLARLLYGSRISLILAPGAALLSTLIAALIGSAAAYAGGWWERLTVRGIDLALSLPWLFVLLAARAMLPLNVSPIASLIVTFLLLGLLGWPGPARVVRAAVCNLRNSDFVLQARANGCSERRLLLVHLLPNLKSILHAQFWISIPVFILAEANLGLLGLGVAEPLPSLGNLLRGLENFAAVRHSPWMLAPVVVLVVVVGSLHLIYREQEAQA